MHVIKRLITYLPGFRGRKPESLGRKGERIALKYLRRQGMSLLAKNVANRFGEIDLILIDHQVIVFVEVRTRTEAKHGEPVETISYSKQRKISRAATAFLKSKKMLGRSARFDAVTIVWKNSESQQEIKHFVNAFEAVE